MKKIAWLVIVALCLTGATFAGEGKKVELEGKVHCAKCSLKQEGGCQNVLVVEKRGKAKHYYLVKNDVYKEYGDVCMKTPTVRVTGTVKRDEGRAWLTAETIEPVEVAGEVDAVQG